MKTPDLLVELARIKEMVRQSMIRDTELPPSLDPDLVPQFCKAFIRHRERADIFGKINDLMEKIEKEPDEEG